jgi:uncharacterized membrane protein YccF (DUF307 family)
LEEAMDTMERLQKIIWLVLKICWRTIVDTERSFNVTTIVGVPLPLHKVGTKQNIVVS